MPEENIFKANPIEIMRLSQSLVKDYIDLRDKTDELMKEYKKLGLSYIDDGYRQLGEVLGLIEKDISERNGHMGLVAHQLDIPPHTASVRLFRLRQKLQDYLQKEGMIE